MSPPSQLTLNLDGIEPLHAPVLVLALDGLFDVLSVASSALEHIVPDEAAVTIGEIDPDPFYDFTVERPAIELVDDPDDEASGSRPVIVWPSNVIRFVRTGGAHDIVALDGVEPHLAWPTFVRCITTVIEQLGIDLVVTLGAVADTTPHTRMPTVTGSTSDPVLARRLALAPPSYIGPTGVVGVLHSTLEAVGTPTVSLRVGVPHYLNAGEHPRCVAALVRHVSHVIDVPIVVDLSDAIAHWEDAHTAAIADDEQLRDYVRIIEAEYDRRHEAKLAEGGDIAAQFEQFLRDHPDDHPPAGEV
ncbi:PAC2 family protein [Desertimonas flava]|uniref:PAC2 family protein n=1 Tax=Desertimonas flava TaxID=2064846 RepID=UPI000E356856|nr:PAC2 family protein [Desertimonas flava]